MVTLAYVPDMLERRQPHRAAHLQNLQAAHEHCFLLLAAAFADPVDGAVLVVEADQSSEVYAWLANDPYTTAGLIRSVSVREVSIGVPSATRRTTSEG
jgi:uncharacterized protein YciI